MSLLFDLISWTDDIIHRILFLISDYNIQLEIEVEEDSLEDGDDPDTDFEEPEESDDEFSDPDY